ncbi:TRAPPC6B [Symbiodinium sp. CCMP2592]|nr:TRAPPC6B [Symbiodinium sp. CCMP2592]
MVMKFVCKDLRLGNRIWWTCLFKKPASRLQVDKQGRYLIQDHGFRWFESFPILPAESSRTVNSSSTEEASILSELNELTSLHLALPCGLLQGALFGLGLERRILVEATPPSVTFTVAKAASAMASSTEAPADHLLSATSSSQLEEALDAALRAHAPRKALDHAWQKKAGDRFSPRCAQGARLAFLILKGRRSGSCF